MIRIRLLVASVVMSFGLIGCSTLPDLSVATVPTSGPIEQGPQLGTSSEGQFIRVIARAPRDGMTRIQVVQGFLDASASFDGDHAVARQFLTAQASASWTPAEKVSVYEGLTTLNQNPRQVVFRANQSGSIDSIGRFAVADPGTELVVPFELTRVNGEWRISSLPQGLVLSSADVDRAFRTFSLYFFNPTFSTLVPDARLIPVFGAGRATTLVRLLVAGPNAWLQPAVRTGFPEGIGLAVESVPIDFGIARVDLTASAQLLDDNIRQAISQQLVWTLRQLPDVTAIDITAGGQPFAVPGAPIPQPRDAWPLVDPAAIPPGTTGFISQVDGVARLIPNGLRRVPGGAGNSDVTLVDIAVSNDSRNVIGLDVDGQLWQARTQIGSALEQVPGITGASSVAFDPAGAIWVVDPARGLIAVRSDAAISPITVVGLSEESEVLAAYPSRDGTRAALIVRTEARSTVKVGRILRPGPTADTSIVISAPIRVESRLTEALDIAWAGANTLLVLGGEGAGNLQVFEVDLARGVVRTQGAPELPSAIAAAPGLPNLTVNSDGVVFELDTGGWTPRAPGLAVTYPN
jgi:hypothetical protein